MNDRALGSAFAPDDIGWIDFETRSAAPIEIGTYAYACHDTTDAIICTYAIGDGPVREFTAWREGGPIDWLDAPLDFVKHHARVQTGSAVWAAWNAGFDKAIWNWSARGFPHLEADHIIDVMAQATAAGLPPDLDMAAKMSRGGHLKNPEGKLLIRMFCMMGHKDYTTPKQEPEAWQRFKAYARDDIAAMRAVFKATLQLSMAEWEEYWAMERINERGVAIDVDMARSAARLAEEDRVRTAAELRVLTAEVVTGVDQVKRITAWLMDRLPPAGRDILTKVEEEKGDDGEITKPAKLSLTRPRIERLLAMCKAAREEQGVEMEIDAVERVLQLRYYGGSKTPAKFKKMLEQQVDKRLYGQYVFNGAPQTGRASSKGVQVHNLARDTLPFEHDAIEALLAGTSYEGLAALGNSDPVSRKLSLLIRTAFVPVSRETPRVFVWSDWSQIEARVLPWLAGDDPGALARLQIFRDVDADHSLPDLYTRTASALSHLPIEQITKPIRQRGKVAELALGFGGGTGALHAMGAGYGLFLSDAEAKQIVERWRAANPWCVRFWGAYDGSQCHGLWGAAHLAMDKENWGVTFKAGRISFQYVPGYLGGSLLCALPSGRVLTYRGIKYETTDDLDDDGNVVGQSRKLRFNRGYGRSNLWHGIFCENVVQATAADFLRGTLKRLESEWYRDALPVRLHTHDEIVCEVEERFAERARETLRNIMQEGFDWSDGLPLMSEESFGLYYTKQEGGHVL